MLHAPRQSSATKAGRPSIGEGLTPGTFAGDRETGKCLVKRFCLIFGQPLFANHGRGMPTHYWPFTKKHNCEKCWPSLELEHSLALCQKPATETARPVSGKTGQSEWIVAQPARSPPGKVRVASSARGVIEKWFFSFCQAPKAIQRVWLETSSGRLIQP